MTAGPRLEFRLLGPFAVLRDGVEIAPAKFGGRKVRSLLGVLASRRGQFVSNDALTDMLWPGRPPADPAANLQVLVNRARNALADSAVIRTGAGGYALSDTTDCVVDAEVFLAAVNAADTHEPDAAFATLRAALRSWGEPLAEDAFADWAVDYRDRLTVAHQHAVEQLAQIALAQGHFRVAIEEASTAASAQPLREAAVLPLVRALKSSGDLAGALSRYERYRRQLADELGIDPSPDAQALHQELLHPGPRHAGRGRPRRTPVEFRELSFVGRGEEVDAIVALLAEQGGSGTAIVSGPSGAGKSRLLKAVTAQVTSVAARAYLPERDQAWCLIRTLLREVLDQDVAYVDGLPPPLAAAARSLLPESAASGESAAPADSESLHALRQEAAIRVLGSVQRVLVVDDLQWADPTSITVLELARARLPALRLLLAYRPEEIFDGSAVARLLRRIDASLVVHLDALSPEAIDELIADSALRDAVVADTDRSPMAVREVLRALATAGLVSQGADQRWRSVDDAVAARATELGRHGQRHAIATRAGQLDTGDRDVLETICLQAGETQTTTLAAATGVSQPELAQRLTRLHRGGLVRLGDFGWTTTHDMVREAVIDAIEPASLAQRHAQLAAALAHDSSDPAETARHWLAAGDRPRAAVAFSRAARSALDAFADQEAVDAATAGLALAPAETPELLEIRAQALGRLGRIAAARDDLRAALAGHRTGPDRARLLGRLAMLASGSEDLVRAAELAEHALVEAGSDQPARAQALEIASVLDMNLARRDRAQQRSATALGIYQQLGDARGAARVLDARAMATFLDGDVRAGTSALRKAADLFEDSGDLVRVITPRSTSGHAMVFGGDATGGLQAATAALELARTLGNPEGQAYSLWHRAEGLSALRRTDEAMHNAREAVQVAIGLGHRGWTATAWRAVGIAAQAAGDLPAALAAFESSLSLSEHLHLFASWAAARAAAVLVALGDYDGAASLLMRVPAEGPPLARYETLLAQLELAAARGVADVPAQARAAISLFDRGGVRQGRDRLVALAG